MSKVSENPRKWNYTWEAQSHLPILKLFIFNPKINPISHCNDLSVDLKFEKSLINLTWKEQKSPNQTSLIVPLPRVLVDLDSPLNFRALDDHIEVKIKLLLPVDHPIVSSFISELNSEDEAGPCCSSDRYLEPLSMDSDFESLSSKGEVDFYCRNCRFKLTKGPIRCLVDLPSVNWTDVADNWFGGCCCSFGGVSEKLVAKYAESYRCAEGTCLLTTASVILCKDDVSCFKAAELNRITKCDSNGLTVLNSSSTNDVEASVGCSTESPIALDSSAKLGSRHVQAEKDFVSRGCAEPDDNDRPKSPCTLPVHDSEDAASEHHCCTHDAPESFLEDQSIPAPINLEADQKSFLNCYLGDAFSFRSSGLSKDIEWVDFACPHCSSVLGAYPCADGSEPLDGGIRLLKCYISIARPSDSLDDMFSKYTLERMFSCQLLESAKDELSFRTVVKDLKTKCAMLHVVLLNPNSWCCSGSCSEDAAEQLFKINLHPVVKVLFSHSCNGAESELRTSQEWETKNQADEIYMLTNVIRELIKSVERAKDTFPPSFNSSNDFVLCSILK